jgi:hypothetical protein
MMTVTTVLTGLGFVALTGCGDRGDALSQPFQYTSTNGEMKSAPQRDLKNTPLERSWDLQLPHPVLRSWISPDLPHLVFFQVKESFEIFALDYASGKPVWVSPGFPKPPKVPPTCSRALVSGVGSTAIWDDRTWVVSDDTLYSFEAVYGQTVWRHELPFAPSTGPLGIGPHGNQMVFMGDWDGRIHVITYNVERNFSYELWQMNLHATVVAPLVHTQGLVYAADQEGGVHCFKLDRAEQWKAETRAPIFGGLVTRDRVLFVGNEDNKLFAFDRLNGNLLGTLFVNGPMRKAPLVFKSEPDRVYVFIDHADPAIGGLACIRTQPDLLTVVQTDAESTKKTREIMRLDVMWRIPNIGRLVGSTPLHLFVTGTDPAKRAQIIAINRRFGRVDWTWNCSEEHVAETKDKQWYPAQVVHITEYQDPSDQNRSIFTVDETGHIIAYRMFGDKPGDPNVLPPRLLTKAELAAAAEADAPNKPKKKADAAADAAGAAEAAPAAK